MTLKIEVKIPVYEKDSVDQNGRGEEFSIFSQDGYKELVVLKFKDEEVCLKANQLIRAVNSALTAKE